MLNFLLTVKQPNITMIHVEDMYIMVLTTYFAGSRLTWKFMLDQLTRRRMSRELHI